MSRVKRLFTSWRIILLLVFLLFSVWFIRPNYSNEGAAIRFIVKDSAALEAGIHGPFETDRPMLYETIVEVNGNKIKTAEDYTKAVDKLQINDPVRIKTKSYFSYDKNGERKVSSFKSAKTYMLTVRPKYEIIKLNETELKTFEKTVTVNETINGTVVAVSKNITYTDEVQKTIQKVVGKEDLGIRVQDAPKTNLIKGLDLQGGTRVMLRPVGNITDDELDEVVSSLKERLDVYGLANIPVVASKDLLGNSYITIEVAGINEEEIKELLSKQGKFEAKIGNETIFIGGKDITYVCRSADCSYSIDPRKPCGLVGDNQYQCSFMFSITLSQEAAKRQADATSKLDVISENGYDYLNESLQLYLDDELVDELRISADLKGKAETSIAISGPGLGGTYQEAAINSGKAMKKLQTILKTGSLPVKLEVVKVDTVSPVLGGHFVRNALLVGLASITAVSLVIFIRYRVWKIVIPIIFVMTSEVVMLLGFAGLSGWNLDLAAIAGIIITVGTGANDLIIITDETVGKAAATILNWKDRIKGALYIIIAAFVTIFVAMLPLLWAGAGLLRGFAVITIMGLFLGVFIARPAYGAIVEVLLKD